ncbi:MAG: ATP-binding protein [Desulfonatronovibrio sp.]
MKTINSKIVSALLKIQGFNFFVFILCILGVYHFMNQISRPLERLTGYARRLERRDLDFEIKVDSNDEIGELAKTLEGMRHQLSGYVENLKKAVSDATDELQQALTYLSTIMDNLADGLVVMDENGRIIRYNLSFKKIFSVKERNLIDCKTSDFIGRDLVAYYHASSSGEYQRLEFAHNDPDKGTTYIEASISMVSMSCGLSYIVVFHDITTRKDMEEELKFLYEGLEIKVKERTEELVKVNESLNHEVSLRRKAELQLQSEKEFFAVTLRSIADAVLTTDKDGALVFINRVAEDILNMQLQNVKGSNYNEVLTLQDNMGNYFDPFQKVISSKKNFEKSRGTILKSNSGLEHQISFKISPIYDRDSQVLGTVMVFQDISHILHLEDERLRKEKLESIGLLAGGIAHDFNNILTAILNHIIMVKSTMSSDDNSLVKMESAQKACLRARRLTQQLLTFSKGGAPIKEATSMAELIEDTIAFSLRGSNVVSSLDISSGLWPANVDPGQISQVLENLVINSAQAMPSGGKVEIEAKNITLESNSGLPLGVGKYVKIVVRDNGCGIDEESLKKIFDPYFTTKKTGTGLGLATTYSIIKNHNGHIEVFSETGTGTEFTVYLPAASDSLVRDSGACSEEFQSGKGRILVLDDDEEILEVVREVLDLLGYDAVLVSDGKEVIEEYKRAREQGSPYDLVIVDLTIPGGMGGLEAIQRIHEVDPQVRAVVSSGYSQDPVMANYKEYGFAGVLAKPYTIHELGTLLKKLLVDEV